MKIIALGAALILAGCATKSEPVVRVVEVQTPVVTQCIPANLPPNPVYSDNREALKAADGPTRYQLTIIGKKERQDRLDVLEPVIDGCRVK